MGNGCERGETVVRGVEADILCEATDDDENVDGGCVVTVECEVGEGNASRYHPPEYVNATN